MKILKVLVSLSLISNLAFGSSCPQDVTALDKGAQAPCKGFLFSPEKEQEMYLLNEDHKLLVQELDLKNKYIDSYQQSINALQDVIDKERQKSDLWRNQAESSTTKLVTLQEHTWQRDLFFMFLGSLTVVAGGYAVSQVSNHNK